MTGRLFIFGLGYSGLEIAKLARAAGWEVAGTVRDADKAGQYTAEGIKTHLFDGTAPLAAEGLSKATHVLCTIAPGTTGDPALRLCAPRLREARWFGYLSTTGVYGDAGGGWVDETTPARPGQPRSLSRLATERAWQVMAFEAGAALDIFRLPGIYGPGRSAIDQVKAGTARRIDKPDHPFSRIHVADIANTVLAALTASRGAIYNVADDLPASTADVVAYACELLAMPVLPLIPWAEIAPTMSEMARSFYAESRRVKNDRIKQELGVTLRYPTYREGLKAIATTSP
ncbi:MAG: SDR family oxidoreductase [Reyranella sp.]|uniref:SDR family oxidoreductase n=1 Tax=Reyranella sp. TaxID=1929291 RepID=UPI001ACB7E93|nr:SDR family oxidoreductase [Reyranella sp.]MBN9086601.1 SDR family oxidoreductase [Reyranella sp.]